ncbi:hypothetical protein SAMN05444279_1461 [Ruegeria intermedia]|uniref:Uncharacterized protein n=1 Tax=Ruegeria intermedia TaxID=996115 RepID=A0A1M5BPH5_9RHOB|nr:hypothetical protein [Ruegeria intermedia]SHF44137.1 hypothetical protein SAMN05444279_1461 [Ruegeria intermedia]
MEDDIELEDLEEEIDEMAMRLSLDLEAEEEIPFENDEADTPLGQTRREAARIRARWELDCSTPFDADSAFAGCDDHRQNEHDAIMEIRYEARRLLAIDSQDQNPAPLSSDILKFTQQILLS